MSEKLKLPGAKTVQELVELMKKKQDLCIPILHKHDIIILTKSKITVNDGHGCSSKEVV